MKESNSHDAVSLLLVATSARVLTAAAAWQNATSRTYTMRKIVGLKSRVWGLETRVHWEGATNHGHSRIRLPRFRALMFKGKHGAVIG